MIRPLRSLVAIPRRLIVPLLVIPNFGFAVALGLPNGPFAGPRYETLFAHLPSQAWAALLFLTGVAYLAGLYRHTAIQVGGLLGTIVWVTWIVGYLVGSFSASVATIAALSLYSLALGINLSALVSREAESNGPRRR